MPARNFIEAIAKGFSVLDALAKHEQGMTLKELTQELKMVKSSIFRLLYTLQDLGYVLRRGEKYWLGTKCIALGELALSQLEVHEVALPFMEALREKFGETINLAIREDNEILYIQALQSRKRFRFAQKVGERGFLHSTALGKCLIAFMTDEELKTIVNAIDLPVQTQHTITSLERLKEELKLTCERGYAVDNEEDTIGIRCIAAPIFSGKNKPIAAISISGPAVRVCPSSDLSTGKELQKVCLEISRFLSRSV